MSNIKRELYRGAVLYFESAAKLDIKLETKIVDL
jgi:hypothetical protein